MIKRAVLFFLIVIFSTSGIFAEGENLTLKVAVFGPGDDLYFWFGHIALIIEDSETEQSRSYDYGIFSFNTENFYYNFAFGRLLYRCGVFSTSANYSSYVRRNRDVIVYTLDVPPETRQRVKDFADFNVRPENRHYYYHHFRDNCSTRIRDIVDLATDGQFKEQYINTPGRFTLREHVRRHTWFFPAVDWILNFWMGQVIDTPITVWDDMFLPAEVGRTIDDFYYTDADGVMRKLVLNKEIVYLAEGRPPILEKPRMQWPRELAFSLVLSAIFGLFFFMQAKKLRAGRILAGISMSLCGLVFGIAGLLLYFMSLFTNHDYTFQNANMIFCTPLLLAALPYGIGYAFTKKENKRLRYDIILRCLWLLTVIGIFISMVIKLLPWFYQQNLTDQMLLLPIALVFSLQPVGLREARDKVFRRKKS